jgi:hypothetical protein
MYYALSLLLTARNTPIGFVAILQDLLNHYFGIATQRGRNTAAYKAY